MVNTTTVGAEPPPRGGQQCRLTLVDDVISDVTSLSNGRVVDSPHRDVIDDAVDASAVVAVGCLTSSPGVKVTLPRARHVIITHLKIFISLVIILLSLP